MPVASIIGSGVIGAGWAARFLLHGWDVSLYDPDPDTPRKFANVMDNAKNSFPKLYPSELPKEGKLTLTNSLSCAVSEASWIQESVPERLPIKFKTLSAIQKSCDPNAIICSSTSGFTPSELHNGLSRPEQILVAHPYNPVYLLPIVELVPSRLVSEDLIERAEGLLEDISMKPITIRSEVPAHVGDRLMEALWREALWLVKDGVASTEQIDEIITHGFGLRWAQMGLFETFRVAGGESGMKHFLNQFGPCLSAPWSKLTDVPELDEELISKIVKQSEEQSGNIPFRELEKIRDKNLVRFLLALKDADWAAGQVLNRSKTKSQIKRNAPAKS